MGSERAHRPSPRREEHRKQKPNCDWALIRDVCSPHSDTNIVYKMECFIPEMDLIDHEDIHLHDAVG